MKHGKRHIALLAAAACLTIFGSCTKFLDIKPYGETIPETPEEFSALLHNHLEEFDQGIDKFWGGPSDAFDLEMYSDNFENSLTKYPQGANMALYVGTQLNNKQQSYASLYSVIRDCNIVIGYINADDTQISDDVLGTAYAIRGVCYFRLLREYCAPCYGNLDGLGVPIVTVFDMEALTTRSTIRETIAQIESDYLKAMEYNIQDEVYRFNNDVLEALLSRLYFWAGDYDKAIVYAEKVLAKHPLSSGEEYKEMLSSQYTSKGEVVFKSTTLPDSSTRNMISGEIKMLDYRPVSKRFIDTFTDGENDVRYSLSVSKRTSVRKFQMSIRSSEMQLILAESYYHKGQQSEALEKLNFLRSKRITSGYVPYTLETLPPVNTSEYIKTDATGKELTPLLNAILNERRKELFSEGDRWFELKRNGRPEFWVARQGRKYTTRQFMYTFPLPIDDILLTPGLIQNPGYDEAE